MKTREIRNLGFEPEDRAAAREAAERAAAAGMDRRDIRENLKQVRVKPESKIGDPVFGKLARQVTAAARARDTFTERAHAAPWTQWGTDLDENSVQQMVNACRLPVAVAGALMPDAHLGYGLPIGGVLAARGAVIPYAVGVDIACRMKLTVLDLPLSALSGQRDRLINAIESETRFGMGAKFEQPRDHRVMDDEWSCSPVTERFKSKAWSQLGTSGSGNHFVEFGEFHLSEPDLGLDAGTYVAFMSHSGSRGVGAQVASHYSKLAMEQHPELPRELKHLAWLDLDSHAGQEYWAAMSLMGRYAAANHSVIHRGVARNLGARVIADIENHHNFAWKENHVIDGEAREVIVHRKGATPAGKGVLGVIPGSMASPAFVVCGKGEPRSLESASHGAGRVMSRRAAKQSLSWSHAKKHLAEQGVHLISAGLDEVPFVYKNIHKVMAQQEDLVDVIAQFNPRIVKMAPDGERAED